MELLVFLRRAWRRRLTVGVGFLLAIVVLVGLGATKLDKTTAGVATTDVALQTPKSQLVDAAPRGADTLAWRASLLSHLMATNRSTAELARRLGVSANQVTVVDSTFVEPVVTTNTALAATKAAARYVYTPYVLTVSAGQQLPIIAIEAAAADKAKARRLASAAVAVLEAESSHGGPLKSCLKTNAGVLGLQPFVVSQVLPLTTKVVSSINLPIKAIVGALLVFTLWCVGARLLPWRRASRRRRPRRSAQPA
jgi:hypothetical protein